MCARRRQELSTIAPRADARVCPRIGPPRRSGLAPFEEVPPGFEPIVVLRSVRAATFEVPVVSALANLLVGRFALEQNRHFCRLHGYADDSLVGSGRLAWLRCGRFRTRSRLGWSRGFGLRGRSCRLLGHVVPQFIAGSRPRAASGVQATVIKYSEPRMTTVQTQRQAESSSSGRIPALQLASRFTVQHWRPASIVDDRSPNTVYPPRGRGQTGPFAVRARRRHVARNLTSLPAPLPRRGKRLLGDLSVELRRAPKDGSVRPSAGPDACGVVSALAYHAALHGPPSTQGPSLRESGRCLEGAPKPASPHDSGVE